MPLEVNNINAVDLCKHKEIVWQTQKTSNNYNKIRSASNDYLKHLSKD